MSGTEGGHSVSYSVVYPLEIPRWIISFYILLLLVLETMSVNVFVQSKSTVMSSCVNNVRYTHLKSQITIIENAYTNV